MSDITNETIDKIDAEITSKTAEDTTKFDSAVEQAVADKLAKIEADKAAETTEANKIAEAEKKESALKDQLTEMSNKQKELQKQLDDVSMRKSIPKEAVAPTQPTKLEDISRAERIQMNKDYASSILNMDI